MTRLWVMSFFEVCLRTCLKNLPTICTPHFEGDFAESLVLRYVPGLIYNNNIM